MYANSFLEEPSKHQIEAAQAQIEAERAAAAAVFQRDIERERAERDAQTAPISTPGTSSSDPTVQNSNSTTIGNASGIA